MGTRQVEPEVIYVPLSGGVISRTAPADGASLKILLDTTREGLMTSAHSAAIMARQLQDNLIAKLVRHGGLDISDLPTLATARAWTRAASALSMAATAEADRLPWAVKRGPTGPRGDRA